MNSLKNCCLESQFWNTTFGECQDFPEPNIIFDGCDVPLNDFQCKTCASNKRLVNGKCCLLNETSDGFQCFAVQSSQVEINVPNCIEFDDSFGCSRCGRGTYLTNGHCCLLNQYFDLANNSCEAIVAVRTNCVKYSAGECIACSSQEYYLSEGFCVRIKSEQHPQF